MITKTRVVGIIIQNKALLMVKSDKFDQIWTPGGKLEEGEAEIECLRRELFEELTVSLDRAEFFHEYYDRDFYDENRITIQKVYLAIVSGTIHPSNEISEFMWVTKNDILKKKFSMTQSTLERIIPDILKAGLL